MVERKKVAIVVGRYYLTLPIIIGFYNLFDWEITVIDMDIDSTHIAREDFFYKNLPNLKSFHFSNDKKAIRHFKKVKYDFVLATNINCRAVNMSRKLGLISKLYILFGAFLKPSLHPEQSVIEKNNDLFNKFVTFLKLLYTRQLIKYIYNLFITKYKSLTELKVNYPDAYDLVFCWNKTESHYYEGKRQILTSHPYHIYLAQKATSSIFSKKILIAHSGDPVYYTPGYNELIQSIIDFFSDKCKIYIKAHPLGRNFPIFKGDYEVIWEVLDENKSKEYDIFISEDSYMAVEMFFSGKFIINYGLVNESASNVDFTHLWSNDASEILSSINMVIDQWKDFNEKHVVQLKKYVQSYTPPSEFGAILLRENNVIA